MAWHKHVKHFVNNVFVYNQPKHISEDTQEMTVAKHSPPEADEDQIRTKQTLYMKQQTHNQRRTATEEPPLKEGNYWFYSRETSPLILMQLQVISVCSVRRGFIYSICETSNWNTYNQKHYDKNKANGQKSILKKKVRENSRECHNHKPQPFPDTKRKRKPTNPYKHKSNKRTKSTKISSLFPKRGNLNAKKTEKYKNKMTQGKT